MGPITDLDLKMAIHDISPSTRAKVYNDRTIDYLNGEPSFSFQDLLVQIIRKHRNHLLKETDWRMTTDYPYSDQAEWASYRTSLRNLPATSEPTLSESGELIVDWPTAPDSL